VLGALEVTIPAGQTGATARFWFDAEEDGLAEGSETVVFTGRAAGLAAGTAILTIVDSGPDLRRVTLSLDPGSVSEGRSQARLTITASLEEAVETRTRVEVSVTGGTATAGTDYEAVPRFTLLIAPGPTTAAGLTARL